MVSSVYGLAISFGICCVCLVGFPGRYEQLKLGIVLVSGILSFLFLLSQSDYQFSRSDGLFLLWIGVLAVVSLESTNPLGAFAGWIGRGHGVAIFIALWGIKKGYEVRKLGSEPYFRSLIVLVSTITVLVPIAQLIVSLYMHVDGGLMGGRAIGCTGEPNAAGFMSVFLGMAYLFPYARARSMWYGLLGIMLIVGSVYATGSRTAGMTLVFLLVAVWIHAIRPLMYRYLLLAGAVVIFAIGTWAMWSGSFDRQSIFPEYESHSRIFRYGIDLARARPLGYGAESLEQPYERRYADDHIRLVDFAVDRSHSIVLDILLWSGVIGLGVWMLWLVSVFREISHHTLAYALCLSLCLFGSFQPISIACWVIVMLIWAEPTVSQSPS
jgi:hypothetical protein